jgi:hypothetical protein
MNDDDARQNRPALLFGIGAQKAGTTWLQSQIERHPGTFFARPKELHYWDCVRAPYLREFPLRTGPRLHLPGPGAPLRARLSWIWNRKARALRGTAARYRAIYHDRPYDHGPYLDYAGAGRTDVRLVGDITPSYALLGRETFAEMLACHPDVRFVFIMRDPVRRLWSGIAQRYRAALPQAEFVRAFEEACRSPLHPDRLRSDYARTLDELEAAVPADRIHSCFFETLLDPAAGAEDRSDLAAFIGLPDLRLDPGEKIHARAGKAELPGAARDLARAMLKDVYDAVRARFGARVPSSWL